MCEHEHILWEDCESLVPSRLKPAVGAGAKNVKSQQGLWFLL